MSFVVREIPVRETRALRQRVLRPHQTVDEVATDEPVNGFAIGAFAGERLAGVGIISAGDNPSVWRVQGMATEPLSRGRGAGRAVLDALVRHAAGHGATRVWCNARSAALSFYDRAGFRPTSAEFELAGIGPHVRMELEIG